MSRCAMNCAPSFSHLVSHSSLVTTLPRKRRGGVRESGTARQSKRKKEKETKTEGESEGKKKRMREKEKEEERV